MIRVLLLHETDPEFQTRRGVEALRRELGPGFDVQARTLGPGGDYRGVAAAAAGLRGREAGTFDVMHAWDERALTAAALAGGRVVFSPSRFLRPRSVGWLRAVMGYRDVQVLCPTATQRRVCVERGVPLERCHTVRPGVEFGRVRRRRDPGLRRRLGFGEGDCVILAAGESTRAAAHERAVWTGSIARRLDERYRVLLWGEGDRADAVAGQADRLGDAGLCSVAAWRLGRRVEFEELLPAADAVLVTARGPVSTLPIAVCMAAALPIVSTVTYTVAELREDRHTALMVAQPSPRLLARRLLELRDDPSAQWTLSDMARTEAYEYFALTRFVNQHREVYRRVAEGRPVEVVEPGPGAGRRFHGRG